MMLRKSSKEWARAPSVLSELDTVNSIRALSVSSKKSNRFSIKSSFKSGGTVSEVTQVKWLKAREYLLLLIEATMSMTAYVIRKRNFSTRELQKLDLTRSQLSITLLYANGFSTVGCIFIACIADSYMTHYTCALLTVMLHFAIACLVFMETTIYTGQETENPYTATLTTICVVTTVLIKSSNFTRLVYGLEGMVNRRKSTIHTFIFLQYWVSSYAARGGIIVNVLSGFFNYFNIRLAIVAFILSGVSLFFFVYLLSPENEWKEQSGLGCSIIGCLFLASCFKICRIKKRGRNGFLGNTEGIYKKATISKTKEIFMVYALLTPSFAVLFLTVSPAELFFGPLMSQLKVEEVIKTIGLPQLARGILATSMLLSYFFLWPLLNLMGIRRNLRFEFLIGHFLLVFCWFYAAVVMRSVEKFQYTFGNGLVRIFNTRDSRVSFKPLDQSFSQYEFYVEPKTAMMLAYPAPYPGEEWLFPMLAIFEETNTNLSVYLSVARLETIGYMILDPPEIARIRGPFIPLREGPPGTNIRYWAKIYIYNTAKTLYDATLQVTSLRHTVLQEMQLPPGRMLTVALEPGTYDLVIFYADISKTVHIEEGGLYGIMIYSSQSNRQLSVDVVRGGNTAPSWPYLALYFALGIASSFTYPSLRAIAFNIAPHGLLAMTFGFLDSLEGISLWICYIGFVTWHKFMTAHVLFAYASAGAAFFFMSMFFLLKYRKKYS